MIDPPRIGIVYRERAPQLLLESPMEGGRWRVDSFDESVILSRPVLPMRDFLAIFYAREPESPDLRRQLANLFPGAELVGFRNPDRSPGGAPLKYEDGALVVQLPIPFYLMRHLLERFSDAREHVREVARLQRRDNETKDFFEAFVSAVDSSSTAADRKLGMNVLINRILTGVQAEECLLYLFGEEGALQRSYATGAISDIDLFEQRANNAIIERVLSSGTPYVNNSYSFELRSPFSRDSRHISSILCYPLVRRGERLGIIEILNKKSGAFTREDQATVEMMLNPLAAAIKTVGMFEEAERLTITDDLTQLYNYRYLMKYLEADVKRCLRYKKKVSLLFIDVDGFKRINDTFGHLVGSQALSEMGQVFKRIVRETDVVGRYGGDEFVIVLPETPLNGAMAIAERIRKKVEECEFVAQNLSIRLTVSLGVANCPKHTLTAEGLIKKADAAMYRAKELSKNSIKVAV